MRAYASPPDTDDGTRTPEGPVPAATSSPPEAGHATSAVPAFSGVGRVLGAVVAFHLATRLLTLLAL